MPLFDKINQGFSQFCMYSNLLDGIKEQRAVVREEVNREKDESKIRSKL